MTNSLRGASNEMPSEQRNLQPPKAELQGAENIPGSKWSARRRDLEQSTVISKCKSGDGVRVLSAGAMKGKLGVVLDPQWHGLVKVLMREEGQDGWVKSFLPLELELVEPQQFNQLTEPQQLKGPIGQADMQQMNAAQTAGSLNVNEAQEKLDSFMIQAQDAIAALRSEIQGVEKVIIAKCMEECQQMMDTQIKLRELFRCPCMMSGDTGPTSSSGKGKGKGKDAEHHANWIEDYLLTHHGHRAKLDSEPEKPETQVSAKNAAEVNVQDFKGRAMATQSQVMDNRSAQNESYYDVAALGEMTRRMEDLQQSQESIYQRVNLIFEDLEPQLNFKMALMETKIHNLQYSSVRSPDQLTGDVTTKSTANADAGDSVSLLAPGSKGLDGAFREETGGGAEIIAEVKAVRLSQKLQAPVTGEESTRTSDLQMPIASIIRDAVSRIEALEMKGVSDPERSRRPSQKSAEPPNPEVQYSFLYTHAEEDTVYSMKDSLYDASAFVGTQAIGIGGSIVIAAMLVANMIIQAVFARIVWNSFLDYPLDELSDYRMWRYTDGHSFTNMDLITRQSLVSRVCLGDPSLSVAFSQADALDTIDGYTKPLIFNLSSGVILCFMCIFMFSIGIVEEVDATMNFLKSVTALRAPETHIGACAVTRTYTMNSMGYRRLVWIYSFTFVRLSIAIILWICGSLWLAGRHRSRIWC
jgi:hypothetical protein